MPNVEAELFKYLEPSSKDVPDNDQFANLDPSTWNKAIAKLQAQDQKKLEKVKDTLDMTHLKELERKEKLTQKTKEKAGSGKGRRSMYKCSLPQQPLYFWMRYHNQKPHPKKTLSKISVTYLLLKNILSTTWL